MFLINQRRHIRGWYGALALMIVCAITGPTFAQGPGAKAQLEAVFKDWQFRQSIFTSARYVLRGATEFKDEQLPPGNPIRPLRFVLLLDLEKKRYRLEGSQDVIYAIGNENAERLEYHHRINTSAYDGKALQSLFHKKANEIDDDRVGDLYIDTGNLGQGAQFGGELWPIFFAHGIVPTVHSPLLVNKLPLDHDPDDFAVAGRQILRGQNCLVVRTEPLAGMGTISDELWINSAQKSAIHRYVSLINGSEPWSRLDVSWKNTPHGWWVDQWSDTEYVGGRLRRIRRLRVESFEANPEVSDTDFTFPVEPGWKVIVTDSPEPGTGLDPSKPASKTYIISPSGAWDEVSAKGYTTLAGKELPPEGSRRWLVWTLGGGLAIGALLFYVFRQRRRRATL